jgi:hypothetical protein
LTKKGRELLAKGKSQFKITQFALADDEVDYDLWNPAHPLGSDYYGVAIENMPITEAVPDETQSMKYKLITLPKGTTAIPYIVLIGKSDVEVTAGLPKTGKSNITPETRFNGDGLQVSSLNTTLGYTATILDSTYATIDITKQLDNGQTSNTPMRNIAGDSETANSLSVIGLEFEVYPTSRAANLSTDKTTKVIVTANETGGRVIVPVTIKKRITTRN